MFLPRAAKPSESVWQQSPDTSLEISSLALKYLDEEQLSKLAVAHSSKAKQPGSRDVNMSMATQEFLNRYGLAANSNEAVNSPNLKTGRRPLTPIHNNPGIVPNGATPLGTKQMLGLRREVLKGRYTSKESGGANYVGENYCVQNYEMRYTGEANTDQQQNANLQHQVRFDHKRNQVIHQQPEVKNRVLDITAIKSQPKFL